MRIIVAGANGQLGRELRACKWPTGSRVDYLSHQELDVTDASAVREKIAPPVDLVINAAAYTAVDQAETNRKLAHQVNAQGALLLASRCRSLQIPLIHLSTDYIFDGRKGSPYVEEDDPGPLNIYGASKLAAERAVLGAAPAHIILRTAGLFSEFGRNFVKSMLRLATTYPTVRVVADQISCPTAAADLAATIALLCGRISNHNRGLVWGTYHFCGQPPVTWFQFAQRIFETARDFGISTPELQPITAAEYRAGARRPAYSALDCSKIMHSFSIKVPSWAARLPSVIGAIIRGG